MLYYGTKGKIMMEFKRAIQIIGLFFVLSQLTFAAPPFVAPQLPASTLPENVSRSLSNPVQEPTGVSSPITSQPETSSTPLQEEAKKIKFKLNGIILEGNTIYNKTELTSIYKNKLKKTITIADLFTIVQNITNYYRNNGYIITRAILPPQHVKNGIVRIRIVEGYIGDVSVSGNPKGARCLVKAMGNRIKECRPLHLSRLEKYLLLMNEIPATQVKAVLSPSKKKTGAADLTIVTENKPITGYFSYDNYGTRYIGPQQLTANVGLNSFIASGDSTQFTFVKTPKGKELTYGDLNYNLPIETDGIRLLLGGTHAKTHPQFILSPLEIAGLTDNYYANLSIPWIKTKTKSFNFQISFNYNDSEVITLNELLYRDHLRSLDLGFAYNFSDSWYGVNLITADLKQGLPILGYTNDTSPTAFTSRPGGRGDYTKFSLQLSRLQPIKGPLSIYGLLHGQYGFNPLLSYEQFSFGGSQIGRGYDVSEIIGDKGAAGSFELRYDLSVERFQLQSIQFYTFYDIGMVWNYKKIVGSPRQISASSTGIGARFYLLKYLSGNIMWTKTLTKPIDAEAFIGKGKSPRVFFSLVASYN